MVVIMLLIVVIIVLLYWEFIVVIILLVILEILLDRGCLMVVDLGSACGWGSQEGEEDGR